MSQSNRQTWLIFGILVMGLLLRFGALSLHSLWLDEAYSVAQARLPEAEIWRRVSELHPPLYYVLLHHWLGVAGAGETAVRLPSALISAVNLLLTFFLARRLVGREAALVAVTLLALAPLDVWYAREARMGVLIAFFGLLAALGLAWESGWGMLPSAAALTAGLYLDYPLLPLWVGITAVWLVFWWVRGRRPALLLAWLLPTALAWLLFQPWAFHLYSLLERLNDVFVFAQLRAQLGLPALTARQYLLALLLIGGGLAAAAAAAYRLLQAARLRRPLVWLLLLGFGLAVLLMPVPRVYSIKRLLVTGWPFVTVLVGWAVCQSGARWRQVWAGLLGVSLLASLAVLATPKDDWRAAAGYVAARAQPGDGVWVDPEWNHFPFSYYLPERPPLRPVRGQQPAADVPAWFVAERPPGQQPPTSPTEAWFDAHMVLVETAAFYRLEVRYYRPAADGG